ncbi:MAG: DUF4190 domain-containing protein [Aeromicrobium sp.]
MSDPTHPQYPHYPGGDQPPPPGNEPPPPVAPYGYGVSGFQGPQANQMALWSMISGIASIPLLCLCGTGFFAGIAALALGLVSKGQIDKSRGMQTGSGQALAGIILGSTTIALAVLYMIVMFAFGIAGSFSN